MGVEQDDLEKSKVFTTSMEIIQLFPSIALLIVYFLIFLEWNFIGYFLNILLESIYQLLLNIFASIVITEVL